MGVDGGGLGARTLIRHFGTGEACRAGWRN